MRMSSGIRGRILSVFLGLALSLVAAEFALRRIAPQSMALYIPDPRVGVLHEPGVAGWWVSREYRTRVHINRDGFRDYDYSRPKPRGAFRIVAIGDSYVEAFQVPLEATSHKVLEKRLRDEGYAVDVPALGVGGFGTAQELLLFEAYGRSLEPDVVLLFFNPGNDLKDNSPDLKRDPRLPYFRLSDGRLIEEPITPQPIWRARLSNWLRNHCQLYSLARDAAYRLPGAEAKRSALPQEFGVYAKNPEPPWQDSWRVTEALLGRFAEAVHGSGSHLLVVIVANQIEMPGAWIDTQRQWPGLSQAGFSPEAPVERLRDVLQRQRIPFIDLIPSFRARASRERDWPHYRIDGHWNPRGHLWAAEEILAAFEERHWLPPRYHAAGTWDESFSGSAGALALIGLLPPAAAENVVVRSD
jgi:hypothetical protein